MSLLVSTTGMTQVIDTVYINRDTANILFEDYHLCAFNHDTGFSPINAVIHIPSGNQLDLTVINTDSVVHDVTIDGYITSGNDIQPGDTATFTFTPSTEGAFRFYSSYGYGELQGCSGMISHGYDNYIQFHWNLFDINDSLSFEFANGNFAIPLDYLPNLFAINGYPDTPNAVDTIGDVTGVVGDSIIIFMANSGNMPHVMHFHGYHVKLLQSDGNPHMLNWVKDDFPIRSHTCTSVLFVPDQPGIYPVHDHNLRAVTNNGVYPGGMVTKLDIDP